jgi:hypothetical protein
MRVLAAQREIIRAYNLPPKNQTLALLNNPKPNHKVDRNLNNSSNKISSSNNSSNKSKEVSKAQLKVEIHLAKRRRRGTDIIKEVRATNNE